MHTKSIRLGGHVVFTSRLDTPYQTNHRHFQGINFQHDDVQIIQGELTIAAGYEWGSVLQLLHRPMVFLGVWPTGIYDPNYTYGRPWIWDACLVSSVLLRHHHEIPMTRSQIVDIFRDLLGAMKVPLRRLLVLIKKVHLRAI